MQEKIQSQEVVDSEERLTYANRLAEYITGLRLNDPEMTERLVGDHEILRAKYNLPNTEARFGDLSEYERLLKDLIQKQGVTIRDKSDCRDFFEQRSAGGAFFTGEKQIGIDINRKTRSRYRDSLIFLEHELIHPLQFKATPSMPIELMEYEAVVVSETINTFKYDPETLFADIIGYSVKSWYRGESEERGQEIRPEWDKSEGRD